MAHKTLPSDIVANAGFDRSEIRVGHRDHALSPGLFAVLGATTARMAQAIRVSIWSLGSARSRPDSQARQKICAGPMIWLKNSVAVIGNSTPLAIRGARQRSMPSARREF